MQYKYEKTQVFFLMNTITAIMKDYPEFSCGYSDEDQFREDILKHWIDLNDQPGRSWITLDDALRTLPDFDYYTFKKFEGRLLDKTFKRFIDETEVSDDDDEIGITQETSRKILERLEEAETIELTFFQKLKAMLLGGK